MDQLHIRFTIETLEDFHIGDGLGSIGLYDDGQLKDNDGIPVLRPETLKGLLKQSGRKLRRIYQGEFDEIFDLVYDYGQMNAIDLRVVAGTDNDQPILLHAFTAIDHANRRAKDKTLRTLEFGASGVRFEVDLFYVMNVDKERAEAIKRFLSLSVRNLKAIGKGRRRGSGLVQCTIKRSEIIPLEESREEATSDAVKNVQGLGLILELDADTTISESGQTGNQLRTLDYLPGSMALGMMRASLIQRRNWNKKYLDDTQCTTSNFYPLPSSSIDNWPDIMPVPLSLRRRKTSTQFPDAEELEGIPPWAFSRGGGNAIADLATRDILLPEGETAAQEFNDKSFGEGYVLVDRHNLGESIYYKVGKQIILRNQIDEEKQTTDDDSLFLEQVIPKGTRLVGGIRFASQPLCDAFIKDYSPWLSGRIPFRVGRGGKPARVVGVLPYSNNSSFNDDGDKGFFTITCVSDVICMDEKLRPMTAITSEFIAAKADIPPGSIESLNTLSSCIVIQSFSGLSGIRRFSDQAIAKGSCFAFRVSDTISPADKDKLYALLSKWCLDGLGRRRNEGFGRIAVNHPIHAFRSAKKDETPQEVQFAPIIQERVQARAEKNARWIANHHELVKKFNAKSEGLSKSQLGRFISILESNMDLLEFRSKIEDLRENTSSRKQMEAFYSILQEHDIEIQNNDKDFRQELILALRSIRTEG